MKELDDIKRLLDAWYEGKTTDAEERLLYEFFASSDVPSEWETEKELFLRLKELGESAEVPADFDEKLSAEIDKWTGEKQPVSLHPRRFTVKRWGWISGIAASLLLCIWLGMHWVEQKREAAVIAGVVSSLTEIDAKVQDALTDLNAYSGEAYLFETLNTVSMSLDEAFEPLVQVDSLMKETCAEINNSLTIK